MNIEEKEERLKNFCNWHGMLFDRVRTTNTATGQLIEVRYRIILRNE